MLIDLASLSAESERRRAALLAEAEDFRLARLARAGRRARTRVAAPPADPPPLPEVTDGTPERSRRDDGAERRYAVPR